VSGGLTIGIAGPSSVGWPWEGVGACMELVASDQAGRKVASSEALTGSGRGEAAGLLACAAIVRSIGEVSRKERNELVQGV
jgi:hypothetical protein